MTNKSLEAWRRADYERRRPNLLARNGIRGRLAAWFAGEGFIEVETPALQVSPGLEPNLTAFATDLLAPDGAASRLYLHTSPEFAMKKLLAAGEARLFQFARVYRNAERSDTHHPEFTMLEWYRAGADYSALMDDAVAMLRVAASGRPFRRGDLECDPALPAERLTVAAAFARHAGIDLAATGRDGQRLAAEARRIGVRVGDGDTWDDLFFRIFLERIEPRFGQPAPTLIHDYPAHMAALARRKPGDPTVAERVELYVCGVELANGFSELTDPAEQRGRFLADKAEREARLGSSYPIDEDFLAALAEMQPAAGMALGFDRLVMLATGAARIDDVLWLPVADPLP
jgi:lysyl-tRNA synthetase class 2